MFSQASKGLRCKALENAVRLLYHHLGKIAAPPIYRIGGAAIFSTRLWSGRPGRSGRRRRGAGGRGGCGLGGGKGGRGGLGGGGGGGVGLGGCGPGRQKGRPGNRRQRRLRDSFMERLLSVCCRRMGRVRQGEQGRPLPAYARFPFRFPQTENSPSGEADGEADYSLYPRVPLAAAFR